MAFPGIIERPLIDDEFSIYLDNTVPIPLSALATFLGKIDKAARTVRGMDGLLLQLSDFALGSNELRFRVVQKRQVKRGKATREERMVAAAEGSAKATAIGAGAAVVSAVAAVVALAMTSGNANPATYRITNEYNVSTIYVQAPAADPHIISRDEIARGRQWRLSKERKAHSSRLEAENFVLMEAMDRHEVVRLAGRFFRQPNGGYEFETMIGNRFPVHFSDANKFSDSPIALEAVIQESGGSPHLDVLGIIAVLSDY